MAATVSGDRPVSPKAATRRSARPTRSWTVLRTDASTPAFVARPANRTATPRATPRMLSVARRGRARRLRTASRLRDMEGLQTEPGEPGDERRGVVRVATAEL